MSNYVPGYGSSTARLAVVGEAPGEEEDRRKLPFVGPSGQIVRNLLSDAGMNPEEVYFTNVCKVRPPGNDIKALHVIGHSIEEFLPQLWEEFRLLQPNCILAIGNTALKYLTGHDGIQHYRGSIIQAKNGIKTVPTIHPASLMHRESKGMANWKDLVFIQWDFERAVAQSASKIYNPPRRNLQVCRSVRQLDNFLYHNRNASYCSLDIETYRTIPTCVGLAFNAHEALSVPLFEFPDRTSRPFLWQTLAKFLNGPTKKIGQNFKFDQTLLECCNDYKTPFGFRVNNFYFDTMLAFRTLYPELPARLEFIASVLTEETYWKSEGKEFNPKKDSFDKLLLYNAKDAAVTFECFEREMEELEKYWIKEFFFDRVMPLHDFYRRLETKGILRDQAAVKRLKEKYEDQRSSLEKEFQELLDSFELGAQVTSKKGVKLYNSPQQVEKLIFVGLMMPHRQGTDDDTLSAMERNAVKDPRKKRVLRLILDLRKVHKTISTYLEAENFSDGRLRTSVKIALETGRTATGVIKAPVTTRTYGMAFQTITKHGEIGTDLRSQFIPDPGYIFLEPDLSQAESRVIAILSNDERQTKIFKYGIDIHRLTASWIFERLVPQMYEFYEETNDSRLKELAEKINKRLKAIILPDERQLGKTFRHAGEGGMEKRRASQLTDLSEWRAGELLKLFHRNSPNIQGVYYKEIERVLAENNRILINPFGRRRQFYNRGDEMLKEAYRQLPQSTVSDHLKFSMLRIEKRYCEIEFLEESHDSFLCQVPNNEAIIERAKLIIRQELETPIDFARCSLPRGELVIPCDIKIGFNWENLK